MANKTWVVSDIRSRGFFLHTEPGKCVSKLSDGARLFTKEEAEDLCRTNGFYRSIDVSKWMPKVLAKAEKDVEEAIKALTRVRRMIQEMS